MINIKTGQILKYKHNFVNLKGTVEVLEVLTQTAYVYDPQEDLASWCTFKDIEEEFDIPKIKWTPKEGETYWYVHMSGDLSNYIYKGDSTDLKAIAIGNVFKTEKEAQAAADGFKAMLAEMGK